MSRFVTAFLLIQAADRTAANLLALQWDPVGGGATFFRGYSATGSGVASHYGCSVQLTPETLAAIRAVQGQFPGSIVEEYTLDDLGYPERRLAQLGLQPVYTGTTP